MQFYSLRVVCCGERKHYDVADIIIFRNRASCVRQAERVPPTSTWPSSSSLDRFLLNQHRRSSRSKQSSPRYFSFNNLSTQLPTSICCSGYSFPSSSPPQNLTPLSRPLYIEIQNGEPSPYLKQLLGKVGSSQIEFMDFTLQGNCREDSQFAEEEEKLSKEMSVIEQQQQLERENLEEEEQSKFQYNPEEYIPDMHLLEIDPATLRFQCFWEALQTLGEASEEDRREYILLFLTDADLETYKEAEEEQLIEVVRRNLSPLGAISKLQRKAKVARYLQKKKKRIWKKKINYDCRKKVADNRLRVKGKFVTREQACEMLGIQLCNQETLKQLLRSQSSQSTSIMF